MPHQRVEAAMVICRLAALSPWCSCVLPPGKAAPSSACRWACSAVPRCVVRPEPQGHADRPRDDEARLPAPPGADVAQHPRAVVRRLRDGRAELPDRAPPVPEHAAAEPQAGPAARARLLRASTVSPTPRSACSRRTASSSATSTHVGLRARDPFECPLAAQLRD